MATDTISHVDCLMRKYVASDSRRKDVWIHKKCHNICHNSCEMVGVYHEFSSLFCARTAAPYPAVCIPYIQRFISEMSQMSQVFHITCVSSHYITNVVLGYSLCHEFRHLLQSLELKWSGGKVLYPLI